MTGREKAKLQCAIRDWMEDVSLICGLMNQDELALNMSSAAEAVFDTATEQVQACLPANVPLTGGQPPKGGLPC